MVFLLSMFGSKLARKYTCVLIIELLIDFYVIRYVLIAFSEIFASITGLEYAFTKAPKNMRSLVMSVFLFTSALSSALGEAFVST